MQSHLLFLMFLSRVSTSIPRCCSEGSTLDSLLVCSSSISNVPCSRKHANVLPLEEVTILPNGHLVDSDDVSYQPDSYCVGTLSDEAVEHRVALICPCKQVLCIRKCCPEGMALSFLNSKARGHCVTYENSTNDDQWLPKFKQSGINYYTLHGLPDCQKGMGMYFVDNETQYFIQSDGSIVGEDNEVIADKESYCSEITLPDQTSKLLPCRQTIHGNKRNKFVYGLLFSIGSLFLLATLVVHLSLPQLCGTVHCKNLTNHVASLLVGYIILASMSFGFIPTNKILCTTLAFVLQFTFMSAFLWLNVMCIDIAWTFSGYKSPEANSIVESEGKKYFYYSLYVWVSSLLVIFITALAEWLPLKRWSSLAPNFGAHKCWFGGTLSAVIFFYLPLSLLLLSNLILFIFTSSKLIQSRKHSAILMRSGSIHCDRSNSHNFHERRFMLYFKLFLLMGISWIFEVISWAAGNDSKYFIFYITDGLNALQGVFIFFLFCVKKKVIAQLTSQISCIHQIRETLGKRRFQWNSNTSESVGNHFSSSTQISTVAE